MMEIPAGVRKQIEEALVKRAQIKQMEDEVSRMKKEANDILLPLLTAYNTDSYIMNGIGSVTVKLGERSSIKKEKLVEAMLNIGQLSADVTNKIMEAATQFSTYTSVEFRADKKSPK